MTSQPPAVVHDLVIEAGRAIGVGNTVHALALLSTITTKAPGWVPGKVEFGSLLMAVGRLAEAVSVFQDVVEIDPTSTEARFVLAVALFNAEDFDGAFRAFRQAEVLAPGTSRALAELPRLHARMGSAALIPWAYRKASTIAPADISVLSAAATHARTLRNSGGWAWGEPYARRAVLLQPGSMVTLGAHLWLLAMLTRNEQARPIAKWLDFLAPNDPGMLHLGATVALNSGEYSDGARRAQHAVETVPSRPATWFLLGRCLKAAGRIDEASQALDRAVAGDAKLSERRRILDWSIGVADFERALAEQESIP